MTHEGGMGEIYLATIFHAVFFFFFLPYDNCSMYIYLVFLS